MDTDIRSEDTFLIRLSRDVRAATSAMMAASMVPLLLIAGSAIDVGRVYTVKSRLQQACDAGALAGRKSMKDTDAGTALDADAREQADSFFRNNFQEGWLDTRNVAFTPTKVVETTGTGDGGSGSGMAANAVSATATADVPLAIMQIFGFDQFTLTVTCQARFDLADTDIMFVLDTTGSMSCRPSDSPNCAGSMTAYTRPDGTIAYANAESRGSKMEALRQAVILFDTTMRTSANSSTNFRYGFVTYSSGVNVGKSIPSQYLQNSEHIYQSRYVIGDYNYGSPQNASWTGVSRSACVPHRFPGAGYARSGRTWTDADYYQARNYYDLSWSSANGGTCSGKSQTVRPLWRYGPKRWDISRYVTGASTTNPTRLDGSTSKWAGCIEEVDTRRDSTFDLNNLPDDLDPDFKPSLSSNKWRPIWPEVEWLRRNQDTQDVRDHNINEDNTSDRYNLNYQFGSYLHKNGSAACGKPAERLKVWSAQQVRDFVNHADFKPVGGTYHDVGMIWGARMLSPDGVFGSDTAAWPGRNPPSRNIVFMTDGTMAPNQLSYGLYGVEYLDDRVGAAGDDSKHYDRHTSRFRIVCDAAKKKGITIYVVSLGLEITDDLTYCASPGQTFQASSTEELTQAFKSIAQRVAMLRITE